MINYSQCKEKMNGSLGRWRTYHCTECRQEITVETLNPLPKIEQCCSNCKSNTGIYTFINKRSSKELQIRASNAELATLRAFAISPNLTFKIPQPNET